MVNELRMRDFWIMDEWWMNYGLIDSVLMVDEVSMDGWWMNGEWIIDG
jgi:hypothetical protein